MTYMQTKDGPIVYVPSYLRGPVALTAEEQAISDQLIRDHDAAKAREQEAKATVDKLKSDGQASKDEIQAATQVWEQRILEAYEAQVGIGVYRRDMIIGVLESEWRDLEDKIADLARRTRAFNATGDSMAKTLLEQRRDPVVTTTKLRDIKHVCLPGRTLPSVQRGLRASCEAGWAWVLAPDLTTTEASDPHDVWLASEVHLPSGR